MRAHRALEPSNNKIYKPYEHNGVGRNGHALTYSHYHAHYDNYGLIRYGGEVRGDCFFPTCIITTEWR